MLRRWSARRWRRVPAHGCGRCAHRSLRPGRQGRRRPRSRNCDRGCGELRQVFRPAPPPFEAGRRRCDSDPNSRDRGRRSFREWKRWQQGLKAPMDWRPDRHGLPLDRIAPHRLHYLCFGLCRGESELDFNLNGLCWRPDRTNGRRVDFPSFRDRQRRAARARLRRDDAETIAGPHLDYRKRRRANETVTVREGAPGRVAAEAPLQGWKCRPIASAQ